MPASSMPAACGATRSGHQKPGSSRGGGTECVAPDSSARLCAYTRAMNDSMKQWSRALLDATPIQFWQVMAGVLALLVISSVIAAVLKRRQPGTTVDNLVARINA